MPQFRTVRLTTSFIDVKYYSVSFRARMCVCVCVCVCVSYLRYKKITWEQNVNAIRMSRILYVLNDEHREHISDM